MKNRFLNLLAVLLLPFFFNAARAVDVYPAHWWVGMKEPRVQLIVHGAAAARGTYSLNYPGVKLVKTTKAENPAYVFLDLVISPAAKPGKFVIKVTGASPIPFELKPRRKGNGTLFAQGVTSADFMYLIMPDRFSNGDAANDRAGSMNDQTFSRDSMYYRHGGDLLGIENHLDYLVELGVTALWLNPVIENNMPRASYHGYAFTDHYKVDPRFGGDVAYQRLIEKMHTKGLKMVQDAVYNHVGTEHWFVKDAPSGDWLNQWPAYTNTTYKDQVLFDPYASTWDKKKMSDGWFVPSMPDLNHRNPYVANFLIQHALWTVEEYGIDGWRIDTYAYNDLQFMNRCNKALLDEYPKISIFGETWVHGVPNQSYFVNNKYNTAYKSNQPGVTDFQTLWGIQDAMTKDFGWNDGVNRLYTTLAQDFVYADPTKNVIFLDNHDLSRFYSVIGEDMRKYRMSIGWLLTARGVPQWYYGAELGMAGFANPDGLVRMDFMGGWPGDTVNKFIAAGRTPKEDSIFNYTKSLANFRKSSSALKTGKLMQFTPEDGVYTYFRFDGNQTIMIVMNTAREERTLALNRFAERTSGFTQATAIGDSEGGVQQLKGSWRVPASTIWIMELSSLSPGKGN